MEIVLGKSKTGKSRYCYEIIERCIQTKKDVILFVPSQARLVTENHYIEEMKKEGVMGVNITTISAYVKDHLKKYRLHYAENEISDLEKKILAAKLLEENAKVFNVYSKVKSKQGFLEMLTLYLSMLKKAQIEPEVTEKLQLKNKFLEEKIKEIVSFYRIYQEATQGIYCDSMDEISLYLKFLKNNGPDFSNMVMIFDGYNNFTVQELNLIQFFLEKGVDITITLNTDISSKTDKDAGNTLGIYEVANNTYVSLLAIASASHVNVDTKVKYDNYSTAKKDLVAVANNLFQEEVSEKIKVENIKMQIQTNPLTEIKKIANEMKHFIKQGYRYQDMVIYSTDVEEYYDIIYRVFFEYEIPFYANVKRNIEGSKLTCYVLNWLYMKSYGITKDMVVETLKLGLNDIDEYDIYEFENYLQAFCIDYNRFYQVFTLNNTHTQEIKYDLEKMNQIRQKVVKWFGNLDFQAKDVKTIIVALYQHLQEDNVFEYYQALLELLKKSKDAYHIQAVMQEEQVWDKIVEIFNAIDKMYQEEPIKVETFYQIFKLSSKECFVKTIPPMADQVEIVDINSAKVGMKKIAFMIGVNEDKFPKKVEQDILFSDEEIEILKEHGVAFKETSISKMNMQLYNISEAFSNVEEKLYVMVPITDFKGNNKKESELIRILKKKTTLTLLGNIAKEGEEDILFSKQEILAKTLQEIRDWKAEDVDKVDKKEALIATLEYFLENEKYQNMLSYQKKDENLEKETIHLLYDKDFATSVSKLESFQRCPFSYFMKYHLKLKPLQNNTVSRLDLGSFMHEVLELFSRYLLEKQISWHEILKNEKELDEKYQKQLEKIINQSLNHYFASYQESVKYMLLKQKLIATMNRVMVVIAKGFNQSDFIPYGYEIEFSEKGIFAPIELELDEGQRMYLIGKIDRIDTLKLEDKLYVRVVDYKSSKKDLRLSDIKEGISLQLITYLDAFLQNKKEENKENLTILPAGMLYFNLSNSIISLGHYTNNTVEIEKKVSEALRMRGIFLKDVTVIEKMDHHMNEANKKVIDISKVTLNKEDTNRALNEEEFNKLCLEAKEILKEIGKKVISGTVKIEPNKKCSSCQYCDFSHICRKNISL